MSRASIRIAPIQAPAPRRQTPSPLRSPVNEKPSASAEYSIETVDFHEPGSGVERIELPHRKVLEESFGRSLESLTVLSGPRVATFLDSLGAEAAALGYFILLRDRHAPREIVAHEVVHALQSTGAPVEGVAPNVLEAGSPAEAEAQSGAAPVTESLPPNTIALKRSGIPDTPGPDAPEAKKTFAKAKEGETATPDEKPAQGNEKTVKAPDGKTAPADGLKQVEKAPDEEPNPTLELPQAPETALSPEELAGRQKEAEETKASLEKASTAEEVAAAYAAAPPTVKAATQSMVGGRMSDVAQADQEKFQNELPEFHAKMGGSIEPEQGVPAVEAPQPRDVVLEESAPPPAEIPELPPTPEPAPYSENDDVSRTLESLFAKDPAEAIGDSLHDVKTTDPDIETSPGDKPQLPVEGDTDPKRLEDQTQAAMDEARNIQKEAAQAVLDGPGPERAQLREMDQQVPTAPLATPKIDGLEGSSEAAGLAQRGMPEEVLAQFDRDTAAEMQANLDGAREQFGQAETDRDESRKEEVSKAETAQEQLNQYADTGQREQVMAARTEIQTQRQATLDAQEQAVQDVKTDAEKQREDKRKEVDDRAKADQDQINTEYDKAEEDAKTQVKAGETKAEAERDKAEKEAEDKSWWEKAVDFVKDAFNALTSLIGDIFDAVRSAVKGILDAVRDFAKGLIDAWANFVKGLIEAFGEVLKGLVDATIGQVFPELAKALNEKIDSAVEIAKAGVDVVADKLKAGVDAVVDALNKALNAILDAYQAAINAALAVMEAVITGDWAGLAKKLLEGVLHLLGIDPADFYAFIGKAIDTISQIIDDPLAFLGHLVDAVVLGFQHFADHFLTHLQAGIIAWLTGALGDIHIPEHFDLAGVLDLARQILGLTWEWLRKKAVTLIGEKNVERLEFIYSYIQTLVEGGFGALWDRIVGDLSNLADTVLGAIKDFLVEKVIIAGITWLASLFSPVGALVKLVMTIWNLYTFLRDQLSRIIAIAKSIVDALANIVQGIIEPAAQKVEDTLANLLPTAIDLIAKLLGLTGVTAKVREVISAIREQIDKAIDALIDKVLKAFKGGGAAEEEKQPGAAEAPGEHVGDVLEVAAEGEPHHVLSIDVDNGSPVPTLHSFPLPVERWLDSLAKTLTDSPDTVGDAAANKQAADRIERGRELVARLNPDAKEFLGEKKSGDKKLDDKIRRNENDLQKVIVQLFDIFHGGRPSQAILSVFEKEIAQAHPDAKQQLEKAIVDGAKQFATKKFDEIRKLIIAQDEDFSRPMLRSHHFGKAAQDAAVTNAKLQSKTGDERERLLSSWVVRLINEGDGQYASALTELRNIMFTGNGQDLAKNAVFMQAVESAVGEGEEGADRPDLLLVESVSGKIGEFLLAVAKGDEAFGKLTNLQETWTTEWWGKKNNRGWLADRFRGSGGLHEWIPTNYVGKVIDRARAAREAEGMPVAELWVTFQNKFRSPTEYLMYPPDNPVYKRKAPIDRTSTKSTATVIQGHVGAVYAPVDDDGFRTDVIAQTKGQEPWHDKLRKIFDDNAPNADSKAGMLTILDEVTAFTETDMWYGDGVDVVFPEYYSKAKAKADAADTVTFDILKGRAEKSASTVAKNFKAARDVVEPPLAKG